MSSEQSMPDFKAGLRCGDVHAGLRNVDPNSPGSIPLADTRVIGMAANLASLVRGQDVIEDAEALKTIAAEQLDISPYAFREVVALSLAHAANSVRAVHVSDVDTALQQYLFGGQMALQEKRELAAALAHYAPVGSAADDDGVLPPWYGQLLELLTRHLRRPTFIGDELRYAEWIAEAQLAKEASTVADAFGSSFNPIAAKLLADVCGFLVTVSRLDPDFRTFARQVCAQADSSGTLSTAPQTAEKPPTADRRRQPRITSDSGAVASGRSAFETLTGPLVTVRRRFDLLRARAPPSLQATEATDDSLSWITFDIHAGLPCWFGGWN
jgi:hypothetical protein